MIGGDFSCHSSFYLKFKSLKHFLVYVISKDREYESINKTASILIRSYVSFDIFFRKGKKTSKDSYFRELYMNKDRNKGEGL